MLRTGLRNELVRFLIVGFSAVAIDFVAYRILLAVNVAVWAAKTFSYIVGAVFAYFANRLFTFKVAAPWRWQEIARFVAVYLVAMFANVGVNAMALGALGRNEITLALAFLAATGTSATMNYLGMKHLVFFAGSAHGGAAS